jgi:hypothetical protein
MSECKDCGQKKLVRTTKGEHHPIVNGKPLTSRRQGQRVREVSGVPQYKLIITNP